MKHLFFLSSMCMTLMCTLVLVAQSSTFGMEYHMLEQQCIFDSWTKTYEKCGDTYTVLIHTIEPKLERLVRKIDNMFVYYADKQVFVDRINMKLGDIYDRWGTPTKLFLLEYIHQYLSTHFSPGAKVLCDTITVDSNATLWEDLECEGRL
jgi:hypothetical protein